MKSFSGHDSFTVGSKALLRQKKSAKLLIWGIAFLLTCPSAMAVTKYEAFSAEGESAYQSRKYPEAEKAFEAAVVEGEKLDKTDKRIATTVYNLALVYQAEGNYAQAEKTMLKALELTTFHYGADHQRVGRVYMDLADLYVEQAGEEGKPDLKKKAAENYQKGIDIFEKIYGQSTGDSDAGAQNPPKTASKKDPKSNPQEAASDLANALRVLADTYSEDEMYREAEPLYKRSLELEEYSLGPESKEVSRHKAKLAEIYCVQGKYKDAAPLFKDALEASEKVNGPESVETARILYNYGGMHYDQGEFGDAEIKFKKALKVLSVAPDQDPIDLAQKNIALADVLDMQGKAEESQTIYKQNMPVFENGTDKGALVRFLKQYQKHLLMQNKKDEAGKIASKIKEIKASQTTTGQTPKQK